MKKLAALTAVIALATALGIAVPAKADKPIAVTDADCPAGTIFDAGHCHADKDDEPLTLRSLCSNAFDAADGVVDGVSTLSEPVSVRNTIETGANEVGGSCTIDLNGQDLSLQQVTVDVEGNLTFIDDNDPGGLPRIIASTITLGGFLKIELSGDVTISRNITINVGTDLTINTVGSVNFRKNVVTSGDSGILTISGDAGVSVKSNDFGNDDTDDFGTAGIGSFAGGEVFVAGNEFFEAAVTISASTGDCSVKDNTIEGDGSIVFVGTC